MLMNLRKKMTNQKGFTLVELMVVIAIIGVLAAISIPKFSASTATAKDAKLTADLRTLDGIVMQIYANASPNAYPADDAAFIDAVKPTYLNEIPKNADDTAIVYAKTTGGYTITGKKTNGDTQLSPGSTPAAKP